MNILQKFVLLMLLSSTVFANQYKDIIKLSLKKDLQKKILVKYDRYKRLFKFRWTLYVNDGLVVFNSYDRRVYQHILSLNHKNQSFRVELKPKGSDFYNVPYLLVKFKEFDYEKNEAIFELYLSDKRDQIELKYLK